MASPICEVNGFSTPDGVDVTAGATVTISLVDTAGVGSWEIECVNTDDSITPASVNASLVVNNITKTATFTAPVLGTAMIWRSRVNSGRDINGRLDPALTTTFGVYVLSAQGNRVIAVNETTEGSSAYGWTAPLNNILRNTLLSLTATAGDGLTYLAGAFNVACTDGSITILADEIQLAPISATNHGNQTDPNLHALADNANAGFLSPAFWSLLDGATTNAVASTLAKRDGSAYCSFGRVYAPELRTNDGTTTVSISMSSGVSSAGASGSATLSTGGATGGNAGAVEIVAGTSTTARGGDVKIKGGGSAGSSQGGDVAINFVAGTSGKKGSLAIGADTPDDGGGGEGVIHVSPAAVAPTAVPSSGTIVFADTKNLRTTGGVDVFTAQSGGWNDLIGRIQASTAPGQIPTFTQVGTTNNYEWAFQVGDVAFIKYHMTHDYAPGTDIHFHVHWFPSGTATQNVKWQVEYWHAKGHNQAAFAFGAAGTIVTFEEAGPGVAYRHMTTESAAVTIAGLEVDSIIICVLTRITNGGVDNANTIFVPVMDVHYKVGTVATKNRTPNFYT